MVSALCWIFKKIPLWNFWFFLFGHFSFVQAFKFSWKWARDLLELFQCSAEGWVGHTTFSCPGSLLKSTPPLPRYPWVSWGNYMTPEARLSGLVLNHQDLKGPEQKKLLKKRQIWSKIAVMGCFYSSSSSNHWWSSTKPLNLGSRITYQPQSTHGYLWRGGIVFSKNPKQVESRLVSV